MLNADERNERWLKVSIGLLRFDEHMMPLVQQLGRLDVRLIDESLAFVRAVLPRFRVMRDCPRLREICGSRSCSVVLRRAKLQRAPLASD